MLLAYIDEIGETGAFVSRDHERYNTSAAFGYGGFILPEEAARDFGAIFTREKHTLFQKEIERAEHPGRWERKGSSIFSAKAPLDHPGQLRVFDGLVRAVSSMGGALFYYAEEKPLGTPNQTSLDPGRREREAMQETLNRIARHCESRQQNVMVMIDQITEKTRAERLPIMYGHIFGRSADFPEMKRIIEPPMHVDSQLSSNIQFADWVAACVGRAVDYQLVATSRYGWIAAPSALKSVRGSFTHESKLRLWNRAVDDLHHSQVFRAKRPVHPVATGNLVSAQVDPKTAAKMRAIHGRRPAPKN